MTKQPQVMDPQNLLQGEKVTYEQALRVCMLDLVCCAEALLENRPDNHGEIVRLQTRAVIRDAYLLYNREDCPSYSYKKS